jgi:hypothetical protein
MHLVPVIGKNVIVAAFHAVGCPSLDPVRA